MASREPFYADEVSTIYHGDCREVIPQIGGLAGVVADPPYALGMNSVEGKVGWADMMNAASFYSGWIGECMRATASKQGAVWCFTSWRSFPVLSRAAYELEVKMRSLLVWDKCWIGPGGSTGLRPSYELVALFAHDGFTIEDRSLPDIWREQYSSSRPTGHPAEKPVGLMRRLVDTLPDGPVLDPFMGSGSTLVAARELGRPAIGVEAEFRWCEVAVSRLREGVLF